MITFGDHAKTLRISTDQFVAANIFINADQTKEESKLAYDARVSRRNRLSHVHAVTMQHEPSAPLVNSEDEFPELKRTSSVPTSSSLSSVPVAASPIIISSHTAPTSRAGVGLCPTAANFYPSSAATDPQTSHIPVLSSMHVSSPSVSTESILYAAARPAAVQGGDEVMS
jgi:hypothetical protein